MRPRLSHRLISGLAVVAAALGTMLVPSTSARADTTLCTSPTQQYLSTTVSGGQYIVQSDEWNDTVQQCMNVTDDGFQLTSGSHNVPTDGPPAAYPSIYAGCHWGNCTPNNDGLPLQVSAFNHPTTSVDFTTSPGQWDASYDIWFDSQPNPSGQNDGEEMMIWADHSGAPKPAGTQVGTVMIDGASWGVWHGTGYNNGITWNIVSYERETPADKISVDIQDFTDDSVSRGYMQRAWYLTSVQFGFEPWQGGPGMGVNGFSFQPSSAAHEIVGQGSGRCVDISGAGTVDGTPMQLWDCGGLWNQQWRYAGGQLVNPQTGKCVDVKGAGTADGTAVQLWTCNGTGAQQWQTTATGSLVNAGSGKCLDAAGQGTAAGTLLQIWTCSWNGQQANQVWSMTSGAAGQASTSTFTSTFASTSTEADNVTVDFGTAVRPVSRDQFGLDVTGYGYHDYVTNSSAEQAMLNGRYGVMRMGLKYSTPGDPTSPIVANGAGADTTVTGDEWVTAIKNLGATPMVIVPEDATDAANLVRHFNTGTNPDRVPLWIIGNEPDNAKESATTYAGRFDQIFDAMKAVDPTIEIGGPAVAWPNMDFIQTFLNISGSRTDFVDFHKYGEGGSTLLCDSQLLANTTQWESDVNQVRTMIQNTVPTRAADIRIQIGEINTDWSTDDNPPALSGCGDIGTEPVQYRNVATVIIASYYLHLLNAGATGMLYGDKNGALGTLYDQPESDRAPYAHNGAGLDERMPSYQGEGFFTGEHGTPLAAFGDTLVASSTTLPDVEVAASSNPKVIVLINKGSSARHALVGVGPAVGQAAGCQKDGSTVSYAVPATVPVSVTSGQIAVDLPAWSVTQLVVS